MSLYVLDRTRPTLDGDLLGRSIYVRQLSLADFARAAGISEPTLRRALKSQPINLRSAQRIATAIGSTEPDPKLERLVLGEIA